MDVNIVISEPQQAGEISGDTLEIESLSGTDEVMLSINKCFDASTIAIIVDRLQLIRALKMFDCAISEDFQ